MSVPEIRGSSEMYVVKFRIFPSSLWNFGVMHHRVVHEKVIFVWTHEPSRKQAWFLWLQVDPANTSTKCAECFSFFDWNVCFPSGSPTTYPRLRASASLGPGLGLLKGAVLSEGVCQPRKRPEVTWVNVFQFESALLEDQFEWFSLTFISFPLFSLALLCSSVFCPFSLGPFSDLEAQANRLWPRYPNLHRRASLTSGPRAALWHRRTHPFCCQTIWNRKVEKIKELKNSFVEKKVDQGVPVVLLGPVIQGRITPDLSWGLKSEDFWQNSSLPH